MNRLLKLQENIKNASKNTVLTQPSVRFQPANNTLRTTRFLPIVGKVTRQESGVAIPLLPVEFEGAFSEYGERINVDSVVFESKTDAKGNFFMAISYMPSEETQLKDGYVKVNIAGQAALFKIPIMPYNGRGKMELNDYTNGKPISGIFNRLGMQPENQLVRKNQLTCIAINTITLL